MKKNMSVFIRYIKDRIRFILLYIIFIITYLTVFILYSLPIDIVFYAAGLCLIFMIIYGAYDLYKYLNKHKSLMDVNHNITATLSNLPKGETLAEEDYQNLVMTLYEDKIKLISKLDQRHTDMMEYFTMWTHQIKNPLSAANLLIQSDEENIKEDISNQIFEIEQYVDMALQYLRLENISSDLRFEEYSLLNMVKDAVRSYSKIFIYKRIKLDIREIDIKVITDTKWTIFVLKQILSNALKYTNEGCISIYLEGDKTLVIRDSGIGISDEDIPRIFERGFTGFNGRLNRKSTGLGLYLSKSILDKLSHKINITSEVGMGTTVKIDFSTDNLFIE